MQKLGYVIRADGTIPFDPDVSLAHRQLTVEAIKAAGHVVEYDPAENRMYIPDWKPSQ